MIAVITATLVMAMMWLPRAGAAPPRRPELKIGVSLALTGLLSRADLATITASATAFDLTDPEMRDMSAPAAEPSTSGPWGRT